MFNGFQQKFGIYFPHETHIIHVYIKVKRSKVNVKYKFWYVFASFHPPFYNFCFLLQENVVFPQSKHSWSDHILSQLWLLTAVKWKQISFGRPVLSINIPLLHFEDIWWRYSEKNNLRYDSSPSSLRNSLIRCEGRDALGKRILAYDPSHQVWA